MRIYLVRCMINVTGIVNVFVEWTLFSRELKDNRKLISISTRLVREVRSHVVYIDASWGVGFRMESNSMRNLRIIKVLLQELERTRDSAIAFIN